jgi:catabolite repression protein CreC
VPSSPNLFLVSHADGTIIVYDKDREDGVFTPQAPTASLASPPRPVSNGPTPPSPEGSSSTGEWNPLDSIFVTIPPWHPVNAAGSQTGGGKGDRDKATKNPVSHWKVSKRGVVGTHHDRPTDERLSVDLRRLRILTGRQVRRGHLRGRLSTSDRRIGGTVCVALMFMSRRLTRQTTRLVDCYAAYFGSLTCVAWSPDGRFIIVSSFKIP